MRGSPASGMWSGTMVEGKGDISWREGAVPYSNRFGDHYYSVSDGRGETQHVYLRGNGLPGRWRGRANFSIAELGFGTGLNFLETWRQWIESRSAGQQLHYTSFEAWPLAPSDMVHAIAAWADLSPLLEVLLDRWPPSERVPRTWRLDEQTTLTIVLDDVRDGLGRWSGPADAWYLDGFAPARNPEMWSLDLMQAVGARTAPGGTFATYSVAGWIRRNLESAGFRCRKLDGFARKRDMLAGELVPN